VQEFARGARAIADGHIATRAADAPTVAGGSSGFAGSAAGRVGSACVHPVTAGRAAIAVSGARFQRARRVHE